MVLRAAVVVGVAAEAVVESRGELLAQAGAFAFDFGDAAAEGRRGARRNTGPDFRRFPFRTQVEDDLLVVSCELSVEGGRGRP